MDTNRQHDGSRAHVNADFLTEGSRSGEAHRHVKVPDPRVVADAERELDSISQERVAVEGQLEAWRETRLRNGGSVPGYEERKLTSRIEVLRLQEANVRNWLITYTGKDSAAERIQMHSAEVPARPKKKQRPKAKSNPPDTGRKRSNRSGGRKKKAAVSRESPSRGISRKTGKRSRVRLIG